jgi:hypothetical protein
VQWRETALCTVQVKTMLYSEKLSTPLRLVSWLWLPVPRRTVGDQLLNTLLIAGFTLQSIT